MTALPHIAERVVVDFVGETFAQRGRSVRAGRAVLSLDWRAEGDGGSLVAQVAGSGPQPYDLLVSLVRDDAEAGPAGVASFAPTRSYCSCPVGSDCKHVAAALLESSSRAVSAAIAAMPGLTRASDLDAPRDARESGEGALMDADGRLGRGLTGGGLAGGGSAGASGSRRAGGRASGGRADDAAEEPDAPGWRDLLEPLASEGAESAGTAKLGVGIDVLYAPPHRWYEDPVLRSATADEVAAGRHLTVGLSLLREGKRAPWIRGGLQWRSFLHPGSRAEFSASAGSLAAQIGQLAVSGSVGLAGDAQHIRLDRFTSPLIFSLLASAQAKGLELVPQGVVSSVLLAGSAEASLDVREAGGGDLAIAGAVRFDDRAAERAHAIGEIGFFALESGELLLGPAEGVSPHLAALIDHGARAVVPAAESADFLQREYPRIRRRVSVVSADDSVALPEFAPPRLRLSVDYPTPELGSSVRAGDPDSVLLEWEWQYSDPPRTLPLTARTGTGSAASSAGAAARGTAGADDRDADEEARVLDAVGAIRPGLATSARQRFEGVACAEFTQYALPQLRDSADVIVEVTGDEPDYEELLSPPHIRLTSEESDKRDWFDLGFEITVDGRTIPFAVLFAALAQGRDKLLLTDKTYFRLDHPAFDSLRTLLAEAERISEWTPEKPRISRHHVSLWEDFEDLADESEPARIWRESVEALRSLEEIPRPSAPAGLAATLRPYQEDGFAWLSFLWEHSLGGILADDMGLGKTLQTLALLCRAREEAPDAAPFLVVAPASVVQVWAAEAARFAPELRVTTLRETAKKRGTSVAKARAGADVVLTSYTVLRLDADDFAAAEWSGLILDEAQFAKNRASRVHAAAAGVDAPFRLAITGTPMENSLADLHALLLLTVPGLFPSPRAFREDFIRPIESGERPERMDLLRRRIRPFLLRRSKELVAADLPEKQEQTLTVELEPAHRRLYESVLQRERKKVLGLIDDDLDRNRFIVFRSLTLLRMLALDPAIVDESHAGVPSSKLRVLVDHLSEVLAEGHRVIVFSQFTTFLSRVEEALAEIGAQTAYLDGSTRDRAGAVERFRSGEAGVFLISLKAGGFGLTLTEADYVFLLDPWWNPAAEAQAVDRAHRIGQTQTVMVYRMVAEGTIEEKVLALQQRKAALFSSLVDGGDAFSKALTADDIRGLFDDR